MFSQRSGENTVAARASPLHFVPRELQRRFSRNRRYGAGCLRSVLAAERREYRCCKGIPLHFVSRELQRSFSAEPSLWAGCLRSVLEAQRREYLKGGVCKPLRDSIFYSSDFRTNHPLIISLSIARINPTAFTAPSNHLQTRNPPNGRRQREQICWSGLNFNRTQTTLTFQRV